MRRQDGVVLVSALIMLLVLMLLSVSSFRSVAMQERMAGNSREKQRAFHAAQAALQYAEWALLAGLAPIEIGCVSLQAGPAQDPDNPACSTALAPAQAATLPWMSAAGGELGTPFVAAGMPVAVPGLPDSLAAPPRFLISQLGPSPDGTAIIYQVTALGYGSDPAAVSVVQSSFAVANAFQDAGAP